jgi:predicted nucleic acid-binding protein
MTWIPSPTARHAEIVRGLVITHQLRGNLVSDAHLAALAIEHGLTVYSADTDFARFPEVRWKHPLLPS